MINEQYIYLYLFSACLASYGGGIFLKKYTTLSGLYFFVYVVLMSLWYIFYYLYFSEYSFTAEQRLTFSRIAFGISPAYIIAFILFILNFGATGEDRSLKHEISKKKIQVGIFISVSVTIFLLSTTTNTIVEGLKIDENGVYREIMGDLSYINTIIYLGFIPASVILYFRKKRFLGYIDRARISKVARIKIFYIMLLVLLQVILPIWDIWILENQIVLIFAMSVILVSDVISKYHFLPSTYNIRRALAIIMSSIIGVLIMIFIVNPNDIGISIEENVNISYVIGIYIITITVYLGVYKLILENLFLGKENDLLSSKYQQIERTIGEPTNIRDLDIVITNGFKDILNIKFTKIVLVSSMNRKKSWYIQYFYSKESKGFYINDSVFIDEVQDKPLNKKLDDIPQGTVLIIPLYGNKNKIVGLFCVGGKLSNKTFDSIEIEEIQSFSLSISKNIKYIETYNQLEDISRNLDRKVDEKTIEYNSLISRQKEFIATLSHEIKAPLTSALLQIDNLSADIEEKTLTEDAVREEIVSIGENLAHTKTLLSQLFTTEYLEKNQATLYHERINIVDLVLSQYHIQKKVHQDILYTESTPSGAVFMSLDKTQFTQVLTNLFTNAAKFADAKNPEIYLDLTEDESAVTIGIEDNGHGLNGIELDEIFEKYTIGKNSIGLGIGLYLCKRIVGLHHGTISAKKGKNLSGIRMEIRIPFE